MSCGFLPIPHAKLDLSPARKRGPRAMDPGRRTIRDGLCDRADLYPVAAGGALHTTLAAGGTADPPAGHRIPYHVRASLLQLAAAPVHVLVRAGQAIARDDLDLLAHGPWGG